MKKIITVFLIVALLSTTMIGCTQKAAETPSDEPTTAPTDPGIETTPAQEEPLIIAYCARNLVNAWNQQMVQALTELQEVYNFTLLVGDGGGSPETQTNQFENYITQGVDGIITMVVDEGMAPMLAELCANANIPLIAESVPLADDDNILVAPSVETNATTFGQMSAQWVYDNFETAFGYKYGNYENMGFITATNGAGRSMSTRTAAAEAKFLELFPDFPVNNVFVADVAGTTSVYAEAAYNQVAAITAARPDITRWVVIAGMDDFAQGALRALEAAGLDGNSALVSMGGEIACNEWKNQISQCWYAACYFSALECADMVMQGMVDVLRNGKTTKDLYPEFKQEGQQYARANFTAQMVTPENYRDIMWSYMLGQ